MKNSLKKTVLSLLLVVSLLCLSLPALAETNALPIGQVVPIENGAQIDLNQDGTPDTIAYTVSNDTLNEQPYLELTVNDQTMRIEGWYMDDQVNVLQLSTYDYPYLLVYDYGPSDDPATTFIYYDENGELNSVGVIYSAPNAMRIQDGIITATVRGRNLYTWFHPENYVIASSGFIDKEDGYELIQPGRVIATLPQGFYKMGLVILARMDIPVYSRPDTTSPIARIIPEGETIVLSGSDDCRWLYLTSLDGQPESAGYLAIDDTTGKIVIGDELYYGSEVLNGLVFAD